MLRRAHSSVATAAAATTVATAALVPQGAVVDAVQSIVHSVNASLHVEVAHAVSQARVLDGLVHHHKSVRCRGRVQHGELGG